MLKKIRIALWVLVAIALVGVVMYGAEMEKNKLHSEALLLSDTPPPSTMDGFLNKNPDLAVQTHSGAHGDIASPNANLPVAGIKLGGDFILTDHNGETYDSKQHDGLFRLIFFGFTYCPAICPSELHRMTQILNNLPEDKLNKIQPIFITIDPERDTSKVMKDYLSLFHPKIIGLTGTPEQIKDVSDLWRVYAARVEDPSLSDYTMDHSTYTYLMDPEGTLIEIFRMKDSAQRMINTLNMRLAD